MILNEKFSPWFPGECDPVYPGTYQIIKEKINDIPIEAEYANHSGKYREWSLQGFKAGINGIGVTTSVALKSPPHLWRGRILPERKKLEVVQKELDLTIPINPRRKLMVTNQIRCTYLLDQHYPELTDKEKNFLIGCRHLESMSENQVSYLFVIENKMMGTQSVVERKIVQWMKDQKPE